MLSVILTSLFYYYEYSNNRSFNFEINIEIIPGLFAVSVLFFYYLHYRKKRKLLASDICVVDKLSGTDFELFLYYHFKKMGYRVRLTPITHDFGADLVLKYKRKVTIVQAKRWNESVGIKAVQEIVGALNYYNADHAIVATNSVFTRSAKILAQANDVQLIDRRLLIQLIEEGNIGDTVDETERIAELDSIECPFCGSSLQLRHGNYGTFYGCSNYPKCKYTRNL
ncbi:membrane protein [Anaeromicropila herbilytica]|uniref:Membrane protein n=2 Tax=Anaeromicropila herbilytica TaxID=2785025 RepID=A0A7R7ENM6_9FIRM|nr:membrane protein [Anaeromicropila herbilytica]